MFNLFLEHINTALLFITVTLAVCFAIFKKRSLDSENELLNKHRNELSDLNLEYLNKMKKIYSDNEKVIETLKSEHLKDLDKLEKEIEKSKAISSELKLRYNDLRASETELRETKNALNTALQNETRYKMELAEAIDGLEIKNKMLASLKSSNNIHKNAYAKTHNCLMEMKDKAILLNFSIYIALIKTARSVSFINQKIDLLADNVLNEKLDPLPRLQLGDNPHLDKILTMDKYKEIRDKIPKNTILKHPLVDNEAED